MPSYCSPTLMKAADIAMPAQSEPAAGSGPLSGYAFASGQPPATAMLRHRPEDFCVDEQLGFEPDGTGDHVWLLIRKSGHNTQWLAAELARLSGVNERDIGYAGLKDRHAVTTQWFSIDMAGRREPNWQDLTTDSLTVLRVERHRRKLRRGTLTGNRFTIRLRELTGDAAVLEGRLETIKRQGVPNYFGEQRFGRDNIARAEAMFAGGLRVKKHQRSIYLSAARSLLFNEVLSQRVAQANWNRCVAGDVMQLDGSNSVFRLEQCDEDIDRRLEAFDIHPSGPLWGKGTLMSAEQALAIETAAIEPYDILCRGLESAGLKQQRRSLRLVVGDLEWRFSNTDLEMRFFLPAGSYATVVVREVVRYQSRSSIALEAD